jgi:putative ABC transport system permease protein
MNQRVSTSMSSQRFRTVLLSTFAGLALVLGAAGIFGVISYWATQRTREIGVRMALGAKPGDVLQLVLGQGMRLTAIGVVIGVAAAFGLSRFLSSLLFGVAPSDPFTFVGVTVVLVIISALACWIPARRAARLDPMAALRHE